AILDGEAREVDEAARMAVAWVDDGAPGLKAVTSDGDSGEASAHPVTAFKDAEPCSMERGRVVGEKEGGGGTGDAGAHDAGVGGGMGEGERRWHKHKQCGGGA